MLIFCLLVNEACQERDKAKAEFLSEAGVSFDAGIVELTSRTTIKFLNCFALGDYYLWDFGDGVTSRDYQPRHSYAEAGRYHLRLVVQSIDFIDYDDDGLIGVDDRQEACSRLLDLYLDVVD